MKLLYITILSIILGSNYLNAQDLNNLSKFTGSHNIDKIIEYSYINNEWVEMKNDKGYINFGYDRIWFKRSDGEWKSRDIELIDYNELSLTYLFKSEFGDIHFDKDFNKIVFFDLDNKNKYEYYINQSEKIDNSGVTQTILYNKDFIVENDPQKALYYATFTKDEKGNIIDYVRFYKINENSLKGKYKCLFVSNISIFYDIRDGEHFLYDEYGNIIRKTIRFNNNKLSNLIYSISKSEIIYDFDIEGRLTQYTEFQNGEELIIVKYNNNQDIIYAYDKNDKYFYQGNPSAGYELTYNEEFEENKIFELIIRDYSAGKTSYSNNGYLMESRNNGGIADVIEVDFDMNNSDWVVITTFDRITSIEGAGIVIGNSEDANNVQLFLVSGDRYFNHYNIYNGFNISSLKDWMFSDNINDGYTRNKLSIMKMKDKIFVSINGKNTYQTDFTAISSNKIGLFVDKINNKINFQDIVIKKLDSSIPAKFYNPRKHLTNESKFKGNGSGFLINNNGFIATNYHVIDGATEIFVEIDAKDYKCKLVATDKENDLAILKVLEKSNFMVYSTINSNKTATGSEIFVLGFPYALSLLGNEIKLTDGKISSQTGFQGQLKTYQISAPVQPGSSGGPLFNSDGDIVGIVSSKFTAGENVGYAIKSKYLLDLLVKNNISFNRNNSIHNLNLVDKVKLLSNMTLLIKVK